MLINTWRDPYDSGFNITNPETIHITPGLTVLVGCNGAGKTTLLHNIKDEMKKQSIPVHLFDNLSDGGSSAVSSLLSGFGEYDMQLGATLCTSSEGESIKMNIGRQSTLYKEFLKTGKFRDSHYKLKTLFSEQEPETQTNIRVFLFDATDSGLSIDNICELKDLFKLILEDSKKSNLETYIIAAANAYELCRNEYCMDVNKGVYTQFTDYEDYRNFILFSRRIKEKRIRRQQEWNLKQKEKAQKKYEKLKADTEKQKKQIESKAADQNRPLTYSEKSKIQELERKLEDFITECRFNIKK